MDKRCKRHPAHNQSNGVCPSCLRERLSHLSASSSSSTTNRSNSSTVYSSLYSSDHSNISSIATDSPLHKEAKTKALSLLLLQGDRKPLKKSRSLAFVAEKEEKKEKRKKGGWFWSKLMGRRKEGDGGLSRSKTVKEKSSAGWVLFS